MVTPPPTAPQFPDPAWLDSLLSALHGLSGPLSALALELATLDELLHPPEGEVSDPAEIRAIIDEMLDNADRSVQRFHILRKHIEAAQQQSRERGGQEGDLR